MTTTETVTLIGIGLTFFVGVFNLIITFRNVRKTICNTPENLQAFDELREKTKLPLELMAVSKKNGTSICQEVADKVREIRKIKLMGDDKNFNSLIPALA